jgi:hypothetical protein
MFVNNTVSYCGATTDTRNHNAVKVFPVVIQYFDWKKNGCVQSRLTEMQQQSNEATETVAQYIKGTPENRTFLICRIFGLLTVC